MRMMSHTAGVSRGLRTELWRTPVFKEGGKEKKSQQRKLRNSRQRGGRKIRWEWSAEVKGQLAGGWLPKGSEATETECGEDAKQAFGFVISRSSEL